MVSTHPDTFCALIDSFYRERSRKDSLRQRASDILHILSAAQSRVERKIALQTRELEECADGERYRLWGDLITAGLYRMKKGVDSVVLENYYDGGTPVEIPLDRTLTPSQNAQKYYKKYTKSKNARTHLTEQLARGKEELAYLASVSDALTRAENERDLTEVRDELYHSGYASRMKNYTAKKQAAPSLIRFRTDDGRLVYCGKNNTANDYLTTKLASRSDWWFHVKNQPGSHVVMQSAGDADEPTERDFTQAAMIAAFHSKAADGVSVPVDYTHVHAVKKPAGSKPGFVIYTTNWTAYVTPDKQTVERLRLP
jgi:predicted ribosome quality control (RQC) complex YloA/Tae2 family protein